MSKKPTMKKIVGVLSSLPGSRVIIMNADVEFITNAVQGMGRIMSDKDNEVWLKVDARFDFDEVLEYIEGLNG